jgi:hypothetical protein
VFLIGVSRAEKLRLWGNFGGVGWSIDKVKQPRLFRAYFYLLIAVGVIGAIALIELVTQP